MGIVSRLEQRSNPFENPANSLAGAIDRWDASWGGGPTKSGVTINETTALNLSAVWAAVRVLTDTVASTPVLVYERLEPRGKARSPGHPIYRLLHDRPNPEMSAFTFKETLQGHLALSGNAYAEKERNGRGEVVALWPIAPNRVTPKLMSVGGKVAKAFVVDVDGVKKVLGPDQVMHLTGFGGDGVVGYSAIGMARESLGLAKAAEEFGGRMFGSGLRAGGILTHPKSLSDIARKNLRESIEKYSGGLDNAHRMMLLEDGLTWTQNTIPPEDAQFLETRKFQVNEVARWFRVPPHMIGDLERSTNNNIEHQSLEFVRDTARPWFVRWEQVLNWELFSQADRGTYFAEFLMDALLRGDNASRAAYYAQRFNVGSISQNEIRELENQNPIDGGDRYYVQGALVPVDKIDDIIDAKKAKPEAPPAPEKPVDDERYALAFRRVMRDAAERVVKREVNEARRALKKGDLTLFRGWVYEFYKGQAEHVAGVFLPVAEAFRELDAVAVGEWWVSESRTALLAELESGDVAALLDRWERSRAESMEMPSRRAA